MTTKQDIRGWLEEGQRREATYMIVVCDTFNHEDYPVYVVLDEDPHKEADKINGKNMQRVIEIYDISLAIEEQLNEERAFHY